MEHGDELFVLVGADVLGVGEPDLLDLINSELVGDTPGESRKEPVLVELVVYEALFWGTWVVGLRREL